MSAESSQDNLNDDSMVYEEMSSVEEKCEEYVQAFRNGDAPSIAKFASSFPELESQILDLLPTVVMMEGARERNLGRRRDGRVDKGPGKIPDLGEFKIIRELGRGGMGIVYEAHQESLDRRVAIKVLPKHALKLSQIAKFCREAATAAKLHHTNIAPVYGVGESNGYHFYAMQLLDGVSMDVFVTKDDLGIDENPGAEEDDSFGWEPLSINDVVGIGQQVASALSYAHEQGVIHRDIKPSNLMLDAGANVWITDFGLAVSVGNEEIGGSGGVSGTLRYMAPEKFSGCSDAPTEDIYSLGITLIELLTGRPAFDAHRLDALRSDIQAGRIANLTHRDRSLPSDLEAVIRKAVAPDLTDRYPSAQALADDLRNFSEGLPVHANPLSMSGNAWRWIKRKPALAIASSLAVVMLLAASAVSTVSYFRVQNVLASEHTQRVRAENASRVATSAMDKILNQFSLGTALYHPTTENTVHQTRLTTESAVMLQQLSDFYLQLATQNSKNEELPIKALSARFRVGEINKRLGRYDESARAFQIALSGFNGLLDQNKIPDSVDNVVLVANLGNQLGVVKRITGWDSQAAHEHEKAIERLTAKIDESNSVDPRLQLELARSHYLLGYRTRPGMGPNSLPPPVSESTETFDELDAEQTRALKAAVATLNAIGNSDVTGASPDDSSIELQAARDYLIAICYRELALDSWSQRSEEDRDYHSRSIALLSSLVDQYPHETFYKFELMRTLSEINIFEPGLRQTSAREAVDGAYPSLQMAVEYADDLTDAQPDFTNYRIELIHANFKLGTISELKSKFESDETREKLMLEQEKCFRKAMMEQLVLVRQYPESIAYKVWLARFSLSLAACRSMDGRMENRNRLLGRAISILNRLPDDVSKKPEVAAIMVEAKRLSRQSLMETETATQQESPGRSD